MSRPAPRLGKAFCIAALLTAAAAITAGAEPLKNRQEILLWPATPPGTDAARITQTITERSQSPFYPDRIVTGIANPSVTAILPDRPNGASMVVAPGGAYSRIVLDKEADEIVQWLRPLGITVFLLKYRLPGEGHLDGKDVPLADGQRAIRTVRRHAAEWGLDPARVGFIGFSAGGHLGASLIGQFARQVHQPVDDLDAVSARPDFAVLMYPVVSMADGVTHAESRANLLGSPTPSQELIAASSAELHVRAGAPPTFIAAADDDADVPTENGVRMYQALKKAGVPAELHIFVNGKHGFGIVRAVATSSAQWPGLCESWLRRVGMLR